jgi:hypothetical protein
MLVVKAKIEISEIDSQVRVIRESKRSIPSHLRERKAVLQDQIDDWESYEFWEWYKALEDIRNSPEFQRLAKSFLARQARQYLNRITSKTCLRRPVLKAPSAVQGRTILCEYIVNRRFTAVDRQMPRPVWDSATSIMAA